MGANHSVPTHSRPASPSLRSYRIITRQPVGTIALETRVAPLEPVLSPVSAPSSRAPSPTFSRPSSRPASVRSARSVLSVLSAIEPPAPPPSPKRAPIPIPHELTAFPLFDTFFDLVDAHEAGGIETPTPPSLWSSVHEFVQCVTSSSVSPPEMSARACQWRNDVRAANFEEGSAPSKPNSSENSATSSPKTAPQALAPNGHSGYSPQAQPQTYGQAQACGQTQAQAIAQVYARASTPTYVRAPSARGRPATPRRRPSRAAQDLEKALVANATRAAHAAYEKALQGFPAVAVDVSEWPVLEVEVLEVRS